jgi:molecular chaperone GrpE (heat shock protein)
VNREEEIAALKDQLAKANAELERIKKRLASPIR